jgi:hypothetical protein
MIRTQNLKPGVDFDTRMSQVLESYIIREAQLQKELKELKAAPVFKKDGISKIQLELEKEKYMLFAKCKALEQQVQLMQNRIK